MCNGTGLNKASGNVDDGVELTRVIADVKARLFAAEWG